MRQKNQTNKYIGFPCDDIACDHGNDFYPEGDCNQCFCQCHDGFQDEICCSEGLVFDPSTNACDWPFNVNGCWKKIFF